MAMGISGFPGGGGMQAYSMQSAQQKQVAQAPKIENEAKSSLLDTEGDQARMKEKEEEARKRVQEETKQQMSIQEHSASAMGFGSKLQMELLGTA